MTYALPMTRLFSDNTLWSLQRTCCCQWRRMQQCHTCDTSSFWWHFAVFAMYLLLSVKKNGQQCHTYDASSFQWHFAVFATHLLSVNGQQSKFNAKEICIHYLGCKNNHQTAVSWYIMSLREDSASPPHTHIPAALPPSTFFYNHQDSTSQAISEKIGLHYLGCKNNHQIAISWYIISLMENWRMYTHYKSTFSSNSNSNVQYKEVYSNEYLNNVSHEICITKIDLI